MQIRFYYIDGISEIDTPYFSTLQAQETYFNNHLVSTMDYAFFPPYYTNIIPVGSDDLNFALNVNYLSFEYLGKTYYYFIENFEYINENLINLHIVKDNIQTFFFNIKVNSGVIERKFIDRYDGALFNRNYIRENYGDGNFILQNKTIYENGDNSFVVVKMSTLYSAFSDNEYCGIEFHTEHTNDYYTTPFGVISFPLKDANLKNTNSDTSYASSFANYFPKISHDDRTLAAYICPFIPFRDMEYHSHDNTYEFPSYSPSSDPQIGNFIHQIMGISGSYGVTSNIISSGLPTSHFTMYLKDHVKQYAHEFIKDTSINNLFRWNYVPALFDNNYMMLEFGSDVVNTTYPLYLNNGTMIYMHYNFDMTKGTRYYLFNDTQNNLEDRYGCGVIDDNVMSYELVNDPWKNYQASNQMRWLGAISNTVVNAASMLSGYNVENKVASNNFDIATRDFRNKKIIKHIKPNSKRSIIAKNTYDNALLENNNTLLNNALGNDDILGQAIKDVNVKMQPPSQKTGGNNYVNITEDANIWLKESKVSNFEYCAWLYHTIGYLVNEPIKNIEDHIFNRVNTRYYYNVLKTKDTIVHLNVLESNEDTEDINRRLEKGLRLWNVENNVTIGTFQYDNVEKSYL